MMVFLQGMALGAGLIVAIGAQNAFVLTQSIKKQHHWLIAAICSLSDMFLIVIGTNGVGSLIASNLYIQNAARWGGALFLVIMGWRSFIDATKKNSLKPSAEVYSSRNTIIMLTLSFTFLNPHVYLDTVLFLGGIGGQFAVRGERAMFATGASAASVLWFFGLAWAGVRLAPLFARESAWRFLHCGVGLVMWGIAWKLVHL